MSLRTLKLKLFEDNPHCFHCGKPTILTNITSGKLPPNAATIDHIISRYNPNRWVKKKQGQRRKVLACFKCNQERSMQETLCLSRAEILKRSQGFSLSPKGNPVIIKPLPTAKEVFAKLGISDKLLSQ